MGWETVDSWIIMEWGNVDSWTVMGWGTVDSWTVVGTIQVALVVSGQVLFLAIYKRRTVNRKVSTNKRKLGKCSWDLVRRHFLPRKVGYKQWWIAYAVSRRLVDNNSDRPIYIAVKWPLFQCDSVVHISPAQVPHDSHSIGVTCNHGNHSKVTSVEFLFNGDFSGVLTSNKDSLLFT